MRKSVDVVANELEVVRDTGASPLSAADRALFAALTRVLLQTR
jgi:hypothetical protein